jgi:undecaprenyl-diphosphatase
MMRRDAWEDGGRVETADVERGSGEGASARIIQPTAEAAGQAQQAAQRTARQVTLPSWAAVARGEQWQLVAGTLFAAFLVVLIWVRRNRSTAFDLAVAMRVQSRTHPWLARFMTIVSWPGFPPQSRILPPLLAWLLWVRGFRLEAKFQFATWGVAALSGGFKLFMRRARPNRPEIRVVVANLGGSSFPSGHVLNYVGVFGFLTYLTHTMVRPARVRRPLVAFFTALIALVGPSRIYQGHHWPTDVLASYLLGLSYLVGLTALYRRAKLGGAR